MTGPFVLAVNRNSGVIVYVLALSQTKDYKIGICWFYTKHTALRRKSKVWLAPDQDNVSQWGKLQERMGEWMKALKTDIDKHLASTVLFTS